MPHITNCKQLGEINKMNRFYIILSIIFLFSCTDYNRKIESLEYDLIQIEFDGLKKEFYKKGNINLSIIEKENVEKLNILKTKNSEKIIFPNVKPVLFQIDLNFINSNTNEKLLITINSNNNEEITTIIGNDNYKNSELYEYLFELISIEKIKNYKGELNQSEYEKYIVRK